MSRTIMVWVDGVYHYAVARVGRPPSSWYPYCLNGMLYYGAGDLCRWPIATCLLCIVQECKRGKLLEEIDDVGNP